MQEVRSRLGPVRAAGWDERGQRPSFARQLLDPVLVLAIAIDTAIAVVDAVTVVVLINLVVIGPLVTALRTGPRQTTIVSLYAFALAVAEGIPHGILGTPDHLARCTAVAVTGTLAVWGAVLRE